MVKKNLTERSYEVGVKVGETMSTITIVADSVNSTDSDTLTFKLDGEIVAEVNSWIYWNVVEEWEKDEKGA